MGAGPQASASGLGFSSDLGRSRSLLAFYFFLLRREILEDAYEIDTARENASGNAKPEQEGFH